MDHVGSRWVLPSSVSSVEVISCLCMMRYPLMVDSTSTSTKHKYIITQIRKYNYKYIFGKLENQQPPTSYEFRFKEVVFKS